MQLKEPNARRRQLALAALAVLGGGGAHAQVEGGSAGSAPAIFNSGFLWYQESANRIRDAELIVSLHQPLAEDRGWDARFTFDSVCGGSPIGALPSKSAQSFVTPTATSLNPPVATQTKTSASGGGGGSLSLCTNPVQNQKYTVAPGDLPIDRSFHDERFALSGGFQTGLGTQSQLNVGAAVSHELDFFSASVNGMLSRDFNSRNTTLAAGLNLESDQISPVGGTPTPWSLYDQFSKGGNRNKNVQDALLGVTQVMSRRWITQANISLEHSSGYETDPYKIITVVDSTGSLVPDSRGNSTYYYENRPGSRNRYGLYWDNKYAFDSDMVEASYRHTQDSWGVHSDTLDLHYRLSLGAYGYFEPHLREYRQSAADFFHFFLFQSAPAGGFASADPRLANFHGQTFGIKYALPAGRDGELGFRIERYTQRGSGPSNPPAGLQGLDLYPGLQAWLLQAGLRLTF